MPKNKSYNSFCKGCGVGIPQYLMEECEDCQIERMQLSRGRVERKYRKCLKCDAEFFSTCFEHRMCDLCRARGKGKNTLSGDEYGSNFLDFRADSKYHSNF